MFGIVPEFPVLAPLALILALLAVIAVFVPLGLIISKLKTYPSSPYISLPLLFLLLHIFCVFILVVMHVGVFHV